MFTRLTIVYSHDTPLTPTEARALGDLVTHARVNTPLGLELDDSDLEFDLESDPLN